MKVDYCVGLCPLCKGNGLLRVVKDSRGLFVTCDECYAEFATPRDALNNSGLNTLTFNDIIADIDEAVQKGWAEYIYVLKNGKWRNYIDENKILSIKL